MDSTTFPAPLSPALSTQNGTLEIWPVSASTTAKGDSPQHFLEPVSEHAAAAETCVVPGAAPPLPSSNFNTSPLTPWLSSGATAMGWTSRNLGPE